MNIFPCLSPVIRREVVSLVEYCSLFFFFFISRSQEADVILGTGEGGGFFLSWSVSHAIQRVCYDLLPDVLHLHLCSFGLIKVKYYFVQLCLQELK